MDTKRGLPTKAEKLFREITFERADDGAATQDEAKRFRVALSSEAPVQRWFGQEILDHSAGSVDMTRCEKRGLPLLMDHRTADQVGRIEDVTLDADKKLRGWMRFGQSARAQEVRQDVIDGIRCDMSIGYQVQRMEQAPLVDPSDDEEEPVYRAVRWMPMEGSMVAVPADTEAGVGRSDDVSVLAAEVVAHASAPIEAAHVEVRMADTPAAPTGATADAQGEVKEIAALARENGFSDQLAGWIEKGLTKEQVSGEIMKALRTKSERTITAAGSSGDNVLGLSERDIKSYNLSRAILASADGDWSNAGHELEISKALAKELGRTTKGFFVPTVIGAMSRAQPPLVAGTSSVGGAAVFTEPMEFIELLRNNMVVDQCGARYLTGLKGPISFPRQITAGTATWAAEDTSIAGSYITLDNLTMNAKTLQSASSYTRQLLVQATPDIDSLIRGDIALIHAIALDLAALAGTGTAQPDGITHLSGVSSYTVGSNGGAPAYTDIIGMERTVELSNALRGSLAYVTNPKVKALLRTTPKLSNTIALPIWEGPGLAGNINGYPAFSTTQLPSNLTKGTSTTVCSPAIFGNFRELLVGSWGAFEMITDPYTRATYGEIVLVSFQMADVGVRHKASFVTCQDFVTS